MLPIVLLLTLGQAGAENKTAAPEVRETWDSLYIGKNKVGYAHSIVDRVEANGQTVYRASAKQVFSMKRFEDDIRMELEFVTYETADGRLYAFDSTLRQKGQDQVSRGRLDGSKMKVTLETLGQKTEQAIDWADDIVGLAMLDRLLREKPLKKDEMRSGKTFFPGVNQAIAVKYVGLGPKTVDVLGGAKKELSGVRMEQSVTGDAKITLPPTDYFVDASGETWRSEISLMGSLNVVSYKSTAKEALEATGEQGEVVDFGFSTLVKCTPELDRPRSARAIVYRLTLGDKEAADSIPAGDYQKVLSRESNVVRMRVERAVPPAGAKPGNVGAEFTSPNGFIQSDDPEIKAVVAKIAKSANAWENCQALEKWVRGHMARSDFTVGFATASDTIRSGRGDCTEHGVLLAALCRAAGVPARTAMGLVYVDSLKSFGYHMWTEVNFDGKWYALDGTLGEGTVGGEHIKVTDGSLKGASALGALLPVFQVMGKLKIEVEKVE